MDITETYIWVNNSFEELDPNLLYQIMHLRSQVFVVEQNCPYLDLDFKDQKAIHLQCYHNEVLVAYCRLFKRGDYFDLASIGRVVVAKPYRRLGLGHELMNKAIHLHKELFGETQLVISAQLYLKHFYESHGFIGVGDTYLEDNIPHIQMKKVK